jgi:hypothetical protein
MDSFKAYPGLLSHGLPILPLIPPSQADAIVSENG